MIDINKANEKALKALLEARPFWVDIQSAIECVPGMKKNMILHANAYHMAVAYEPLSDAIARIEAAGDGPVTSVKRV